MSSRDRRIRARLLLEKPLIDVVVGPVDIDQRPMDDIGRYYEIEWQAAEVGLETEFTQASAVRDEQAGGSM